MTLVTGKSVGNGARLADYMHHEKNQSSKVIDLRGSIADDLKGAFAEWNALAAATQCEKPLYSVSINPEPHERLTEHDYLRAADILEKKLGLTGQPRAVVIQVNEKGRQHAHVVWSRIDLQTMTAISDSHNYHKQNQAAREIEKELDLEPWRETHHLGHGDMVSEQRAANAMFIENSATLQQRQADEKTLQAQDSYRDTAQCVPPEHAFQPENAAYLDHGKPIVPPQEPVRPELEMPDIDYFPYEPELGNVFDDNATTPTVSDDQQQNDIEPQQALAETSSDVPAYLDHDKPIVPPTEHESPEFEMPDIDHFAYEAELGNVFDDSATTPTVSDDQQQKDSERQQTLAETSRDVPAEQVAEKPVKAEPEQERDIRAEINALYREHFPDSGNDADQSRSSDKGRDSPQFDFGSR